MTLYEMVCSAEVGRKIHICIHDVSGILNAENLRLDISHRIHSCVFCDIAKETAQGYLSCVRHKERVNRMAAKKGRPFFGMCPYGLWEIAYPVRVDEKNICIIYLGNILENRNETSKKYLICRITWVVILKNSFPNLITAKRQLVRNSFRLREFWRIL